ncbi:WD40 repeat protein [Allofrancisella inopinata]|uniref:WD40 repeat domain-containing protein n=1 Tax=Allofrancisella inopinata TaxID=1085647 RepID=A0AAE7CRY7_9GAMM|nr:WD40 repeat domain-containing protein [Allofrancisella inopinata]QIV96183.1 WD40 repeat domain-containing protein [Allofrancisella inopinata]TDT72100.1 WD40 repeat protein [Allofrancisella inopinata]
MTNEEFDIYWYKTLSAIATILLKHGLSDINQNAIEPLVSPEKNYTDASNREVSNPMVAYNKLGQLLESIRYMANNQASDASLDEIHKKIKSQLRMLYIRYANRLSISQLIFSKSNMNLFIEQPKDPSKIRVVSNGERITISRALLSMIGDYLNKSSYRNFRKTAMISYIELPPLPLLPLNYQNYITRIVDTQPISALKVLANGKIVTGHKHGIIKIWDLDNPTNILELRTNQYPISALEVLSDEKIISGSGDGTIRIWDLNRPTDLTNPIVLRDVRDYMTILQILPDRKKLLSASSRNDNIRVWDLDNPTNPPLLLPGHQKGVLALKLLPDGERIISSSRDGTIQLWNLNTQTSTVLRKQTGTWAFEMLPDGRIVSQGANHTIDVWHLNNPRVPTHVLKGHKADIHSLKLLPDGRIVSGSADYTIRVWDITEPESPIVLEGHLGAVNELQILPDGEIVNSSNDCSIRVWGCLNKEENIKINRQFINVVIDEYKDKVKNRKISLGIAGKRVNNKILPDNLAKAIVNIQNNPDAFALLPHSFFEKFVQEIDSQVKTTNGTIKKTKLFTSRDDEVTKLYKHGVWLELRRLWVEKLPKIVLDN